MKKSDVIQQILGHLMPLVPKQEKGLAFAPSNIALCKYWGKRNAELNIPMTSSLSIALPDKGALTSLYIHEKEKDEIVLDGEQLAEDSSFYKRTIQFLDLFRPDVFWRLHIDISMNIPVAAGLASSACGFASLTAALNDLFNWKMPQKELSIIARLGSGSASRSLWTGFVEWHAGVSTDGMDSYSEPLPFEWPDLYIAILPISYAVKKISSREAMRRTVDTSILYGSWPKKVLQDMIIIKQALHLKKFPLLGGTVESNALNMHATILSTWPPICYFLPETIAAMQKIWELRKNGLDIFFTQDAGPNLKLLFLKKDKDDALAQFPTLDVIQLFEPNF